MKKYIIIISISLAALTGCTTNKVAADNTLDEISWTAFCAARGHNLNDSTSETINEYLDTWCGSVEEEQVFINEGVELN